MKRSVRVFFFVFALVGALVFAGCLGGAGTPASLMGSEKTTTSVVDTSADFVKSEPLVNSGSGKEGQHEFQTLRIEAHTGIDDKDDMNSLSSFSLFGDSLFVGYVWHWTNTSTPGLTRITIVIRGGFIAGNGTKTPLYENYSPLSIGVPVYAASQETDSPFRYSLSHYVVKGSPYNQIGGGALAIDGNILGFKKAISTRPYEVNGESYNTWELELEWVVETPPPPTSTGEKG